jgi:shikimate kinase
MTRNMNVVLVGMPGCGKSTVGKLISEKCGKSFVDTDAEIEKNGITIPDMFEKYGEDYFRSVETHEIEKASKKSSCIIATGGGAVKRSVNIDAMRQNSVVFYIKRDIQKLGTDGRPLSKGGTERLEQLYAERHCLYEKACDFSVDFGEDSEMCAQEIVRILENIDYYTFRI